MNRYIVLLLALFALPTFAQSTPLRVTDENGNKQTLTVTSPTLTVPSVTGSFTTGHPVIACDTLGTLCDNLGLLTLPGTVLQDGTTTWGKLLPHVGGPRWAQCSVGNTESPCASDGGAAVYNIPVSQIGMMLSSSGARIGSSPPINPTDGVKNYFPTFSAMSAAGYAVGSRDGFATFSFIDGAPGTQFTQVCMNDSGGKFTSLTQQAWDLNFGCVRSPYLASAVANFQYNGSSILYTGGTANWGEFFGQGQLFAHGQSRVFVVSVNPSWNVGPSLIGKVAQCQDNGQGLIENANNDSWQLTMLAGSCTFHAASTSTTAAEWLIASNSPTGGTPTAIQAGAAYAACLSLPCADGSRVTHAAGNYVQIVGASNAWPNFESGGTFTLRNNPGTLGSVYNDDYIGEVKSATTIEFHQLVTPQGFGPPSSFTTSDTLLRSGSGISYNTLQASSISSPHCTDPMGFEIECVAHPRTIVGIAYHDTSGVYLDNPCNRNVASWYGRRRRSATCGYTTTHTVTSTTNYVEPSGGSEIRTSFVYLGAQANQAQYGAAGDDVPWSITATASNDSLGASRPLVVAAGTLYAPGDTSVLAAGTSTIATVLTVTNTTAVSATVAAGGSGCLGSGTKSVTGTVGTGTKAVYSVTVSGGAITTVLGVTSGGNYTAGVTGSFTDTVTGFSCSGAQLNVVMGALLATPTTRGAYTNAPSNPVSQASSSGSGTGATWNITFNDDACQVALGLDTFTVADGSTVQPIGVIPDRGTVTISGMLTGLTETRHLLSALFKAPDGGTCTAGAGTRITAQLLQ